MPLTPHKTEVLLLSESARRAWTDECRGTHFVFRRATTGDMPNLARRMRQRVRLLRDLPSSASLRAARYNCFALSITRSWITPSRPDARLLAVERGWRATILAAPCNAVPPTFMTPGLEGGIGLSVGELMVQHFSSALSFIRRSAVFEEALAQWADLHRRDDDALRWWDAPAAASHALGTLVGVVRRFEGHPAVNAALVSGRPAPSARPLAPGVRGKSWFTGCGSGTSARRTFP